MGVENLKNRKKKHLGQDESEGLGIRTTTTSSGGSGATAGNSGGGGSASTALGSGGQSQNAHGRPGKSLDALGSLSKTGSGDSANSGSRPGKRDGSGNGMSDDSRPNDKSSDNDSNKGDGRRSDNDDRSDKDNRDGSDKQDNDGSGKDSGNDRGDNAGKGSVKNGKNDGSDASGTKSSNGASGNAGKSAADASGASPDIAGAADNVGKASNAANGAANAANASQNAAGIAGGATAAAGAEAAGAAGGVAITPQDINEIKNLDVKGDMKDLGKDLSKGDIDGVLENETARKALDVAAKKTMNPYVVAANEALKLNDELKAHGGGISVNKILKGDVSAKDVTDNIKALQEVAKEKIKPGNMNPADMARMQDGEAGGIGDDDFEDIQDMDEDDAKPEESDEDDAKSDDEESEDEDDKDDDESEDTEDSDEGGEDEEEEEEENNEQDNAAAEQAKQMAARAMSGAASAAAQVAPYVLIVKAAYAFAQWLYMMMMSLVQYIAQTVLGFWAAVQAFFTAAFTAIGNAVATVTGLTISMTQSALISSVAVVVVVVAVIAVVSAVRYDMELQTMLSDDKGVTFSVGCSEQQKGFFEELWASITNDPVGSLSNQQVAIIKDIAAVMKDESLPANKDGVPEDVDAYIYGVLANAYAVSGIDPFLVGGSTEENTAEGTYTMSSILNGDGKIVNLEQLAANDEYVTVSYRDNVYSYGVGIFQFRTYRNEFLNFCYGTDGEGGLVSTIEDYVDITAEDYDGSADEDEVFEQGVDWYTPGAQISYMIAYPTKVMFFTQPYDPEALKADGIDNVEDIDYSDAHVGWSSELSEDELVAARASTLFLGTYERPASYLNGGDDRKGIIMRRASMAISLSRKIKELSIMENLNEQSIWAGNVIGRITSSTTLATIDAVKSGYTNCGINTAAWDLSSPAAVGIMYSHPERYEGSIADREPTLNYAYIVSTIGNLIGDGMVNDDHYGSCDRGVSYAYYVSGWDTEMHFGGVDDMRGYLELSDKWEVVADIPYPYPEEVKSYSHPDYDTEEKRLELFQPGDVIIDYGINHVPNTNIPYVDAALHVYMYVGNDMVLKVKDISKADVQTEAYAVYAHKELVEASFKEYYPSLRDFGLFRNPGAQTSSGGVVVYRCMKPDYDSKYRDIVRYGAPEAEESDAA